MLYPSAVDHSWTVRSALKRKTVRVDVIDGSPVLHNPNDIMDCHMSQMHPFMG